MRFGRYEVIQALARGGMAEVFLARMEGPGLFTKDVVVKRILPEYSADAEFVKMFLNEATLGAQLNHPNIIQTFELNNEGGSYFIAMEHVDGPSLSTLCRTAAMEYQVLPYPLILKIVSWICDALTCVHEACDRDGEPLGLIHRDVSPDNILISRAGVPKLADFGIAKAANLIQDVKTRTGMIKGKFSYLAPEMFRDDALDRRIDIYALGVVLYEALTGQKPFKGTTDAALMQSILNGMPLPLAAHRKDLPEGLQAIVNRALARDAKDRFQSASEFQAAIEALLLTQPVVMGTTEVAGMLKKLNLCPPRVRLQNLPLTFDDSKATPAMALPKAKAGVLDLDAMPVSGVVELPSEDVELDTERGLNRAQPAEPQVQQQIVVPAMASKSKSWLHRLGVQASIGAVGLAVLSIAINHQQRADAGTIGSTGMAPHVVVAVAPPVAPPPEVAVSAIAQPRVELAPVATSVASAGPSLVQAGALAATDALQVERRAPTPTPAPVQPKVLAAVPVLKSAPVATKAAAAAPAEMALTGWLTIHAKPGALVLIDGKKVGVAPLDPLVLSAGAHHVDVGGSSGEPESSADVNIVPGDRLTMRFVAERS